MPPKSKEERAAATAKARAALAAKRKVREGGGPSSETGLPPENKEDGAANPGGGSEGEGLQPKPPGPPPGNNGSGGTEGEGSGPKPNESPAPKRQRRGRKPLLGTAGPEGQNDPADFQDPQQLPPLGDAVCVQCIRSALAGLSYGECAPSGTSQKCQHCREVKKPCVPATGEVLRLGLRFLAADRTPGTPRKSFARVKSALREALDEAKYGEGEGRGEVAVVPPGGQNKGESLDKPVQPPGGNAPVDGGSAAGSSSEAKPSSAEAAGLRAAIDSLVGSHLPAGVVPAYNVLMDTYAAALRK
ncbi:hypothetical protein EsH8_III_000222 [Colletotrichum jinshuiense]